MAKKERRKGIHTPAPLQNLRVLLPPPLECSCTKKLPLQLVMTGDKILNTFGEKNPEGVKVSNGQAKSRYIKKFPLLCEIAYGLQFHDVSKCPKNLQEAGPSLQLPNS